MNILVPWPWTKRKAISVTRGQKIPDSLPVLMNFSPFSLYLCSRVSSRLYDKPSSRIWFCCSLPFCPLETFHTLLQASPKLLWNPKPQFLKWTSLASQDIGIYPRFKVRLAQIRGCILILLWRGAKSWWWRPKTVLDEECSQVNFATTLAATSNVPVKRDAYWSPVSHIL